MLNKASVRWLKALVGKKNLHMKLHFQIKQKFVIFNFLQCHGGLLFFVHVLNGLKSFSVFAKTLGRISKRVFQENKGRQIFRKMFVFRKIWRALFSWNTRFDIRPFALLLTMSDRVLNIPLTLQTFLKNDFILLQLQHIC